MNIEEVATRFNIDREALRLVYESPTSAGVELADALRNWELVAAQFADTAATVTRIVARTVDKVSRNESPNVRGELTGAGTLFDVSCTRLNLASARVVRAKWLYGLAVTAD